MKNTLTYRSLVAYIISVVPEIMEDFHICSECSHSRESHYWNGGGLKEYSEEDSSCHSCGCEEYKHSVTKILGRPITLADVLRAMKISDVHNENQVSVTYDGHFFDHYDFSVEEFDCRNEKKRWLLGEPLSEQSDELKLFLHSLLVP